MSIKIWAHIALLGVSIIYGLTFVIAKEVMPEYLNPFGFIFWRVGLATLFFWVVAFFVSPNVVVERSDLTRFLICGATGAAINMMLFFKGLSITKPINASILMMGTPIVVMLLAALFLKERTTFKKQMGIVLGILGSLMVLLFNADFTFAKETFAGDLMVFLNALSYGVYLIMVKPLLKKYDGLTVAKWVFLFGFVVCIPFTVSQGMQAEFARMPSSILWMVFYIIFISTILSYFLNLFSIAQLGPTAVSVYIYAQPLVASAVAVYLGKDFLSLEKIVGGLLIFIGVYLVSIAPND